MEAKLLEWQPEVGDNEPPGILEVYWQARENRGLPRLAGVPVGVSHIHTPARYSEQTETTG